MPSPVPADDITVEAIRFGSGPYRLEGELAYADGPSNGAALIAGPHPLLGGTMRNNVVRGLTEGLAQRGVTTLRFNYRGVGNSEGPPVDVASHLAEFWATSHVADEPAYGDDVAAAATTMRDAFGDQRSALIGYSFGCSLLPYATARAAVPLILIAPTIGTHDYAVYADIPNPLLVVASEDDFAAEARRARRWFDGLGGPGQLVQGCFDNHFFRGHEEWLAGVVFDFICETWETVE